MQTETKKKKDMEVTIRTRTHTNPHANTHARAHDTQMFDLTYSFFFCFLTRPLCLEFSLVCVRVRIVTTMSFFFIKKFRVET